MKILHVRDMEPPVNAAELEETIWRTGLIEEKSNLSVKSTKLDKFGNQTATVQMPEKPASQLSRRGRIRVGLSNCRIHERIEVERHKAATLTVPWVKMTNLKPEVVRLRPLGGPST